MIQTKEIPKDLQKLLDGKPGDNELLSDFPRLVGQKTVVLVEDNDQLREIDTEILQLEGYQVYGFRDYSSLANYVDAGGTADAWVLDGEVPARSREPPRLMFPSMTWRIRSSNPDAKIFVKSGQDQRYAARNLEIDALPKGVGSIAITLSDYFSQRTNKN